MEFPDVILPSQVERRNQDRAGDCRKLYRILLEESIANLRGQVREFPPKKQDPRSRNARITARKEARWWFEHPDSGRVSLRTVCEILGMDLERVRARARAIR